mmetsp:Transcript_55642/g.146854  ORF Transcript_55642/g.146854 Transcript_55642/m.146854 type:complete len:113 (+) Transcript_55642:1370-1708(+)
MAEHLKAFNIYVPDPVVRMVHYGKEVAHLGVEPRDVTIMFCDADDTSCTCHDLDPSALVPFFAEYLDAMSESIVMAARHSHTPSTSVRADGRDRGQVHWRRRDGLLELPHRA